MPLSWVVPPRDDAGTRRHAEPGFHHDFPFGAEKHIPPRAELDQPHAFAGSHMVARLFPEYDAPRNQPSALFENHPAALTLHSHDILLVLSGTRFAIGDVKMALAILHLSNRAGDRRAVHVDIKNAQKDAD